MTKVLGVDFAPLNIPFERRLQTLAVVFSVMIITVFPVMTCLLLLALLFSRFWWLAAGYLGWMVYDINIARTSSRGGRRSQWLRTSKLGYHLKNYFPASLVKTAELDPSKNYILGSHPHGILGAGSMINFGTEGTGFSEKYPGIRPHLLTLEANFRWPIVRGYCLWMGLCDVSKESIQWIMTKQGTGNAAVIVVGGAAEALEARPGKFTLTLKKRKGFVKMAIRTGASLVPVFTFGENDLYKQADNPSGSIIRIVQEKFKQIMGFSPPLFYGRGIFNYTFGMVPYRKPIHTVIGAPIDVPHEENPSIETVDRLHQEYMEQLTTLFDQHKTKYGIDENKHLELQ